MNNEEIQQRFETLAKTLLDVHSVLKDVHGALGDVHAALLGQMEAFKAVVKAIDNSSTQEDWQQ